MYTNLFLLVVAVTATVALTKQDYCEMSYPRGLIPWWNELDEERETTVGLSSCQVIINNG